MAIVSIRRQVQLCIGKAGLPVGSLVYVRQGRRENSAFAYDENWLASPARFNVSADLQLMAGHQSHKAASPHDSVFHGAPSPTLRPTPGAGASSPATTPSAARMIRGCRPSRNWTICSRWMISAASARCACATRMAPGTGRRWPGGAAPRPQHPAPGRVGACLSGQPGGRARR